MNHSLDQLLPGATASIVSIRGNSRFKKRLLEMGFVNGTAVYKEKLAPLADPAEYIIKGYHVSLRREEAADIIIAMDDGGENHGTDH